MPGRLLTPLIALLLLAAPASAYEVTTRTASHGVPHIVARDFASLGYGYAYSFARDNVCTIADSYVTVRGERSRWFGPDATWVFSGNGSRFANLPSDFFFKRIIADKVVERLAAQPPPKGPRTEILQAVRGYVDGYNAYLRDVGGPDGISDPACKGKGWVRPIEEIDVLRRFYQLALLASSGIAIDGIGNAQPPFGGAAESFTPPTAGQLAELRERLDGAGGIGSNAVALGREATQNGRGMLLGNPHFPWEGAERFYQSHLTVPGKLDVQGASLYGVPIVLIGSTRGLAWSHTVSTARRFTLFQETLVPGSPTKYFRDGRQVDMKATKVTVDVKQADGSVAPQSRTLYATVHGPVVTSLLGLPLFPWTPAVAHTLGDANAANFRYLNHFFEINQAQSTREALEVLRRNQGIPWVNTLAADKRGEAFYADISTTPNVSDGKATACASPAGLATFSTLRVAVLDGSRSSCDWDTDADAIQPGTLGPSRMPYLFRDDYVTNSNDSHWLSNPRRPLEGFPLIIGDERTPRSLRTRLGLDIVEGRLAGTDGYPGRGFTLDLLTLAAFNNRVHSAELWRPQLVDLCSQMPTMIGSSGPVDVSGACDVLARWDGRDDLDSKGAVLFRRFAQNLIGTTSTVDLLAQPPASFAAGPFSQPFNAADPVRTPRGLATAKPTVQKALADAVDDLQSSELPLDVTLRRTQFEKRGDDDIPIHGGPHGTGVFNVITAPWVAGKGFPTVVHGSSWVMAVAFDGTACPKGRSIVTYSQSSDPTSPHSADQTRMYSRKQWNRMRFCERDVLADKKLGVERQDGRCRTELDQRRASLSRGTAGVPRVTLRRRGARLAVSATGCGPVRSASLVRGARTARLTVRGRGRFVTLVRGSRTARIALRRGTARAVIPLGARVSLRAGRQRVALAFLPR